MDNTNWKLTASTDQACSAALAHAVYHENHSAVFKDHHCHSPQAEQTQAPEPLIDLPFNKEAEKGSFAAYLGLTLGHDEKRTLLGGHEDTPELLEKASFGTKPKPGVLKEEEVMPWEVGAGFHIKF